MSKDERDLQRSFRDWLKRNTPSEELRKFPGAENGPAMAAAMVNAALEIACNSDVHDFRLTSAGIKICGRCGLGEIAAMKLRQPKETH